MAQPVDRAYTVLLSHLHKPSSNLPFETLESLIIHFLARTPSPTPLCATIISSPLFRPFSHAKLTALTTAFRHAAHAKYKLLKEEPANIFTQSLNARMESWARAVVNGLNGGQGVIRLVGAGGILLGLEDLKGELKTGKVRRNARGRTEDEVVIALAEVMDMYGGLKDDAWEREFHPGTEHGEVDVLSLALLFACQFLGHIDTKRLSALPLATLLAHLMSTIERAFMSGRFLASLGASSSVDPDQKVSLALNQNAKEKYALPYDEPGAFQTTSQLSIDLRSISSSTLFASIALLSRTSAHLLPILVDTRPRDGWITLEDILKRFNAMAATVELHWSVSIMAGIDGDAGISPDSQEIATTMWTVLKTLLFAAVMVSQSALTALVYSHRPSPNADSVSTPTAESLALLALDILHHFAFVISTFGGIASGGFTELKKVFYTALDVLGADASLSEEFVINMSRVGSVGASSKTAPIDRSPYNRSLLAFRLTCIEQLVPVLSPAALEVHVFQLCVPHLFDHTHRDTFESAHSVVLALFAAQARKHTARGGEPTFVEKLVPFYAQCLLENSAEGKLSVSQLCLAYNALVSSASATSDSLTSYCLFALYEALGASSTDAHRQHRLRLTLISCLSALSLAFLAPALDRVQQIVRDAKEEEKVELVEELFKELMEHVGDQEKELAMRWWADNNKLFAGLGNDTNVDTGLPSEKGKGKELQITPRL